MLASLSPGRARSLLGTLCLLLPGVPVLAGSALSLTVRDSAGTPVPEAVVYLQGSGAVPAPAAKPVLIDQRDKRFVPAVTVIPVGTEVTFSNNDLVSHHIYSFARPNAFEVPLYKGDTRPVIRLEYPGIVTLGCNIHDSMVGWIVVVDTPYFGQADEQGSVVITGLPSGEYEAFVWSPRLDPARPASAGRLAVDGAKSSGSLSVGKRMRAEPSTGALAGGDY